MTIPMVIFLAMIEQIFYCRLSACIQKEVKSHLKGNGLRFFRFFLDFFSMTPWKFRRG